MRLLDKYILKNYLTTFFIIMISFMALFIVIDVFDRLPRVLKYEADGWLLVQYFLLRIPYLAVLVCPVIVLLSGLFLMNTLSKYNESIAIRAAGISIFRMVSPLLWVGFFTSILVLLFGEYVLPLSENYRNYVFNVQIKKQMVEDVKMRSNINYAGANDYLYYIGFFDGYQNIIKVIDITQFDGKDGTIQRKISANEAVWNGQEWIFMKCYDRKFSKYKLNSYNYSDRARIPEITATPLDFIKSAKSTMSMNFFELKDYISRLKKIGEKFHVEMVDLYMKISYPLANFIILLFCVPLATTSVRSKGRGIIFLIGLIICFSYLTTLRICQSLGYNEVLSPFMAAWLPHMIFATLGSLFVIKAEI